MIQYSGGPLINRTFVAATRADWVNNVTQAVADAGWTTISGSPGSGSDVLMQTAVQNIGCKIRFRFFDPGTGFCAQVTMKHPVSGVASSIAYALPTAGTGGLWRVIANKFTFYAFASGGINTNVARGQVFGGTLWTPAFLNLAASDPVGWMSFGGAADTDANLHFSLRKTLSQNVSGVAAPPWAAMFQSNLINSTTSGIGDPSIAVWQGGANNSDFGYRWINNTLPIYEPLMSWATGALQGNEGRLKGQLYDALVVNGQWTGETTISIDGHTWMNITDAPQVNVARTACLFLAVT